MAEAEGGEMINFILGAIFGVCSMFFVAALLAIDDD